MNMKWILLASICLVHCGCHARALGPNPNDALRSEIQELQDRNQAMRLANEQLQAQLTAGATTEGSSSTPPSAELREATPRPAEILIEKLSRAERGEGGAGALPQLRLFLQVVDGHGRATQLTGSISVVASLEPEGGKKVLLSSHSWSPMQVSNLYRSGMTGSHYTVVVPLQVPAEPQDVPVQVLVTYMDGWSGRKLEAATSLYWTNPEPPAH